MISKHYINQRYKREKFIDRYLNGDGNVIDNFIINKGHKNGLERHCVTENGIIVVYNAVTDKLITKKIARPSQIKSLYATKNKNPPKWLLDLCYWHQSLNYNK